MVVGNTSYFAFARHALVAGLRHLQVEAGDEVAVPELICRDVLSSINSVGAVPRYYPVGSDLRPTSVGNTQSARFVIAVNYFGFPQDLRSFQSLWPDACLIEDNAHGYLSADEDGNPLGSRASVGITSFRKTLRVPDGAILDTASPLDQALLTPACNRSPGLAFQVRSLLAVTERVTQIPTQQMSRAAIRLCRRLLTGSSLPTSSTDSEITLPCPTAVSEYSLQRLHEVEFDKEVIRRRNLYTYFESNFRDEYGQPVFPCLPKNCSPYGFPFYSDHIPRQFIRIAARRHCEIISWPDLPEAVSVSNEHVYRRLRVVNFR